MPKILVIEDNPDNMDLVDQILEDAGYEMFGAINAELGLELLKAHTFNLILMDISLPKMSGLEAIKIIKNDTGKQHIPIIALTAHAMQTDKENALAAGADAFLTKPIDEERLLSTIQELII